ncbi:telomerase protein component 1-like [Liolophura sinensis]|uniref:telomerase protein component 1-like n=1 Tax=Liolophura sinensis TaxID=3198878 RepID=UPI0031597DE8
MNQSGGALSGSDSDMETETTNQKPPKKSDTVPKYDLHSKQNESDDVLKTIASCWSEVDRQCSAYQRRVCESPDSGLGWKTVRLFVSSTFTDFFNEREVLVKKVFPELREWCEDRKISLIECDLRWGVPKDSTSKETICTCLEEIDRCQEENGQPFFLNLLGDRYGWIPSESDVPDDIKEKYGWVPNASITFMEILCGAYRMKNPNAAFFVRDSQFLQEVPESQRTRFVDDEPLKSQHLKELKRRIRERFPEQVYDYACKVDTDKVVAEQESPQVSLLGLEGFAQQVLDFFKNAIENKYSDQLNVKTLDKWEQERQMQFIFIKQKSDATIGRDGEVATMLSYAQGETPSFLELTEGEKLEEGKTTGWEDFENLHSNLTIISPPGFGKTSLMAKITTEAMKAGLDVFYHFVGSTSASCTAKNLLTRLKRHVISSDIQDQETDEEEAIDVVEDSKKVLSVLAKQGNQLLIVLDGVNQLLYRDSLSHLAWLPPGFPCKTRCIVSAATEHPRTVERLLRFPTYKLHLGEVSPDTRKQIVTASLGRFNKRLDAEQLELLLSHPCAPQPLWLIIVCEELRVFGDFGKLTGMISKLPESLDGLLEEIIRRLIAEDSTQCMEKSLCLISSSRRGLPVSEVLNLLGDLPSKTSVPLADWAQVRRCIKPFIRTVPSGSIERIFFFHQAMEIAVRNKLVSDLEQKKKWSTHFADYLEFWCDKKELRKEELPDYLREAHLKARLANYLRKSPDGKEIGDFTRSSYLQFCRCKNFVTPNTPMISPLMLCMFCGMNTEGFSVRRNRNSESCVICGTWMPRGFNAKPAYICGFHSNILSTSSFLPKCYLCKRMVKHDKNATTGLICQMCSSPMAGKMCVVLE